MSVGKDSILRAANADAKTTEVKAEAKPAEEVKAPAKSEHRQQRKLLQREPQPKRQQLRKKQQPQRRQRQERKL